jgi:hypothetical protein
VCSVQCAVLQVVGFIAVVIVRTVPVSLQVQGGLSVDEKGGRQC